MRVTVRKKIIVGHVESQYEAEVTLETPDNPNEIRDALVVLWETLPGDKKAKAE